MGIQEKMKLFHDNPVVAWHEHINGSDFRQLDLSQVDAAIEVMDMYGVDKVVTSLPLAAERQCPPEHFCEANNRTYEAFSRHPGRLYGQAFVNPGYMRETLYELERCADLGFVGVKLYHQYYMDDPAQFQMIEKCIDLNFPILMHSARCTDWETNSMQPRLSNGVHMANIARRYPEATFIMGHIGGGGDWQWSIKAIENVPNVYADMSGSVHDRPLMEESVKYLGADRILFASDGSWESAVAKMLGSDITDEEKKTILAGTAFQRFIEKAGK